MFTNFIMGLALGSIATESQSSGGGGTGEVDIVDDRTPGSPTLVVNTLPGSPTLIEDREDP